MTIGGCCGAFPLILYEVGSRLATFQYIWNTRQPLSGNQVTQRLRALVELMISDGEQRAIWAGPPLPLWQIGIGSALLAIVFFCLFVRIRSGNPAISRWRRAFAMATVVLTGIMLVSGLGIAQHHLVAILPLAFGTLAILSLEVAWRFRPAIVLLATAAAGLAVLSLSWDVRIDRGLRRSEGKGFWSSAVEDVGRFLESHPVAPRRLKILNWGFQKNLYVSSGGSVYGSELFWGATKARSSRGITWESEIRDGGSFLLFLFPTGPPTLDAAAAGFSEALQQYRGARQERSFFDRSGSPIALLAEIMPTR